MTKDTSVERMIRAARDSGYEKDRERCVYSNHYECGDICGNMADVLLDPTFWQCAGKSLGWRMELNYIYEGDPSWLEQWHTFIDHLANGPDINSALEKIV